MEAYERLEQLLAFWVDGHPDQMVVCSSGTAALHLALESFSLPKGSAVIVPDYTFIACARACTLAGLVPVFADCGDDLLMDPRSVEQVAHRERDRVKALMPVHVYGRSCNMQALHQIAETYELVVVEDLAEAHGIRPDPASHAACWSFYKNKVIHGEEGGALYLNKYRASVARVLRTMGNSQTGSYIHLPRGHNYRLANSLALLIQDSLLLYDDELNRRRTIEAWYDDVCPNEWKMPYREVPWVYDVRIRGRKERIEQAVMRLRQEGYDARNSFLPCSLQQEYATDPVVNLSGLNWRAAKAASEVVTLPLLPSPVMTRDRAQYAIKLLKDLVNL